MSDKLQKFNDRPLIDYVVSHYNQRDNKFFVALCAVITSDQKALNLLQCFDDLNDISVVNETRFLSSILRTARLARETFGTGQSSIGLGDFDICVERLKTSRDYSHGCKRLLTLFSNEVTIQFKFDDNCSIFIYTYKRIFQFENIHVIELELILYILCKIKGINELALRKFIPTKDHTKEVCMQVFMKLHQCLEYDLHTLLSQVVQLPMNYSTFLERWGQYGDKTLNCVAMCISKIMFHYLLYHPKIINALSANRQVLSNEIRILSVNKISKEDVGFKRYQVNMVLRIPIPSIENLEKLKQSGTNNISGSPLSLSLVKSMHDLHFDVKHEILNMDLDFNDCQCDEHYTFLLKAASLNASETRLKREMSKEKLLFPISRRTITTLANQQYHEIYCIYIMPFDHGAGMLVTDVKSFHSITETETLRLLTVRVLDQIHFKGISLDLNLNPPELKRRRDGLNDELRINYLNNEETIRNDGNDEPSFTPIFLCNRIRREQTNALLKHPQLANLPDDEVVKK